MNFWWYFRQPRKMYSYLTLPSSSKPRYIIRSVHLWAALSASRKLNLKLTKTTYQDDEQPSTARFRKSCLLSCAEQFFLTGTVRFRRNILAAEGCKTLYGGDITDYIRVTTYVDGWRHAWAAGRIVKPTNSSGTSSYLPLAAHWNLIR